MYRVTGATPHIKDAELQDHVGSCNKPATRSEKGTMGWQSMMSCRKREWHHPSHALKSSSVAAFTLTCAATQLQYWMLAHLYTFDFTLYWVCNRVRSYVNIGAQLHELTVVQST